MNETIYTAEKVSSFCFAFVFLFFFRKKVEKTHKQKGDISDGLSEATGIHQKC